MDAVAAVICAAGSSSRMGGVKKEYQKPDNHGGFTVLGLAVSAFAKVPSIEVIAIAVNKNGEAAARAAIPPGYLSAQKPKLVFVTGGASRRASVFNALSLLADYNPRYVLIHDGARPWVSPSLIAQIIEEVKKHGAAVPLLPLTDTPKECDAPFMEPQSGAEVFIKTHLKRANTGIAQTPQGFKFPEIFEAHKKAAHESGEFTDDAEIWGKYCGNVAVVQGSPENRKITFPQDLE